MFPREGAPDKVGWGRASYLPALNVDSQFVHDESQNFDTLRFGLSEWKRVSPYLLEEFYTLTPWHSEKDITDFTAFCYLDPIKEEGVILAFRQEKCQRGHLEVALPFAVNGDRYNVADEDSGEEWVINTRISLDFDAPRTSKLLWIKKI